MRKMYKHKPSAYKNFQINKELTLTWKGVIIVSRGLEEMAREIMNNPQLSLKLFATAFAFSAASAKLYSYQMRVAQIIKEDVEHFEMLMSASFDDEDLELCEMMATASREIDQLNDELD